MEYNLNHQKETFELVKSHSKFLNKNTNNNNRWKKFIDAVYVIHTGINLKYINEQLEYQGFHDIVVYLETCNLANLNQKFVLNGREKLVGCHISHALCCEHALENNYNSIIILEDDCYFNRLVTDDEIQKLVDLKNKYNPLMINLSPLIEQGVCTHFINKPTFNIIRNGSALTHFININKDGMNKILETKTNPPPIKTKYPAPNRFSSAVCWFGADDFWTAHTDMYTLVVPDKITIASQYLPGRTKGNHNVDKPFQYRS